MLNVTRFGHGPRQAGAILSLFHHGESAGHVAFRYAVDPQRIVVQTHDAPRGDPARFLPASMPPCTCLLTRNGQHGSKVQLAPGKFGDHAALSTRGYESGKVQKTLPVKRLCGSTLQRIETSSCISVLSYDILVSCVGCWAVASIAASNALR